MDCSNADLAAPVIFQPTPQVDPSSVTLGKPTPAGGLLLSVHTLLPLQGQLSTEPSFSAPATSSSPKFTNIYTLFYPDNLCPNCKTIQERSQGCQTDGTIILERLIDAVYDLNRSCLNGATKAILIKTLL